jgi:hypothetical protein
MDSLLYLGMVILTVWVVWVVWNIGKPIIR